MTEEQRVKLEGLIDEYGRISNEMCCGFYGRKEEGKALKDITDFLTEIQNNCISLGCYPNEVEDRAGVGDDVHVEGRK